MIPVNERGDGVPRFPLNWRAFLTGSRRCNAWGIDLMVVLAEKGQKFSLRVPEKKSSKRLLMEIFATVVDVLAELCLNKNWERLR